MNQKLLINLLGTLTESRNIESGISIKVSMSLNGSPYQNSTSRPFEEMTKFNSVHTFDFIDNGQNGVFLSIYICRNDNTEFQSSIVAGAKVEIPLNKLAGGNEQGFCIFLLAANQEKVITSKVCIKTRFFTSKQYVQTPLQQTPNKNTFINLFPIKNQTFFNSNPFTFISSHRIDSSNLKNNHNDIPKETEHLNSNQDESVSIFADQDSNEIDHVPVTSEVPTQFNDLNQYDVPENPIQSSQILPSFDDTPHYSDISSRTESNELPALEMKHIDSTFPPLENKRRKDLSGYGPNLPQLKNHSVVQPFLPQKPKFFPSLNPLLKPKAFFKKTQF